LGLNHLGKDLRYDPRDLIERPYLLSAFCQDQVQDYNRT